MAVRGKAGVSTLGQGISTSPKALRLRGWESYLVRVWQNSFKVCSHTVECPCLCRSVTLLFRKHLDVFRTKSFFFLMID